MAGTTITVRCPLCGWHWSIEHKGSKRIIKGKPFDKPKGRFNFSKIDPKQGAFISIRESRGGREGFPEIERISLEQVVNSSEYGDLVDSLIRQCYSILKVAIKESE